jgi:5-methylcytosine-specific restriction protein A
MAGRNPDWSRDELILALDLYVRHRPAVLGNTCPEVIELSEVLNQLARAEAVRSPTHRNPNGVAMKFLNLRPFDPEGAGHAAARPAVLRGLRSGAGAAVQ